MLKEQTQEFTDIGGERMGDCYRTALACLLEIDKGDVPHFMELYPDARTAEFYYKSIPYVEDHVPGWTLTCLSPTFPTYMNVENCPDRVVLTGASPRGDWNHAVIADSRTGDILWDPHPSRDGVGELKYVIALTEK